MDNEVRTKKVKKKRREFDGKKAKIANALRNLREEKQKIFLAIALGEAKSQEKVKVKEKIRKLEEEFEDLNFTIEMLEREEVRLARYL